MLTIRREIFLGFLAICAIAGLLGLWAIVSVESTGRLVVETFDKPLMAINHARSANANFLVAQHVVDRARLPGAVAGAAELKQLDAHVEDLDADLVITKARLLSGESMALVDEIRRLMAEWSALARRVLSTGGTAADWEVFDAASAAIIEKFDVLINVTAGDAFTRRQQAIATIGATREFNIAALVIALATGILVTIVVTGHVVRPIRAASAVAERIAHGELTVDIPSASSAEARSLFASMAVMQHNLRTLVERERDQSRSAQARMIDAIEGSREAMMLIDKDRNIVIANSQTSLFFAPVAKLTAAGTPFSRFIAAAIEDGLFLKGKGEGKEALAKRLAEPSGSDATEEALADGRWLRMSWSQARDGGAVVIWSDISALKEREAALQLAKDKAETANIAKSNFLANMSHELRTPLNAIIGFSEIIEGEMLGPVGQEKYKGFARDILQSGRNLLTVINNILDIAKGDSGTLQLRAETIDVLDVFEVCQRAIEPQCKHLGLSFTVVEPDTPLELVADRAKVIQIVMNLLSNALKFTPVGGQVTLLAGAAEGGVEIKVVDTGIGMRTEDIPTALAPFGQVDARLARKYEGTGLGLPLSKALVDLHGGTLSVVSVPAAGTTVTVFLPSKPRGEHTVSNEAAAARAADWFRANAPAAE
jgi:signal transduction histidine kinase